LLKHSSSDTSGWLFVISSSFNTWGSGKVLLNIINMLKVGTLVLLKVVKHVEIRFIGQHKGLFVGIIMRDCLLEQYGCFGLRDIT
jgi:hypothetical protein